MNSQFKGRHAQLTILRNRLSDQKCGRYSRFFLHKNWRISSIVSASNFLGKPQLE